SGRYDFIAAPTTVTKERAESMLFTAGYLWTAYQFGIKKGSAPIKGWADLKGKVVSVNKGTPYETLSKAEGEKNGFTVQAYDTQPDATQAVLSGRAYATLGGNTTIVYAASKNPDFVADLELTSTRAHWAAPFPKTSVALRNQMQDVMSCMKRDGTIARMSEKWFGKPPAPDALERVITPGYGVPGMPGYDPTPHELKCGWSDCRRALGPQAFSRPLCPEGRRSQTRRARAGVRDRAVGIGQVDAAALSQPAGGTVLRLGGGR